MPYVEITGAHGVGRMEMELIDGLVFVDGGSIPGYIAVDDAPSALRPYTDYAEFFSEVIAYSINVGEETSGFEYAEDAGYSTEEFNWRLVK